MDIIVSHQLTDFDGLGAMVAAHKLYPEAIPVFPGRRHRLVKDFMVLYKDEIEIKSFQDIDTDKVTRVIIVDTNKRDMLGELNSVINWELVEVIVYDHHPHDNLSWADQELSEDVGSATTILVNKIIERGLELNPFEATVCALAIYADTGNLTYLNTHSEDAAALSYLLKAGANLRVINEFIKEPLNTQQEDLLENLLDTRYDIKIDGIQVTIFKISIMDYVGGINRVVEQIKSLYHLPTIFVLVETNNKVEVIGRSSDEAVNIGRICSYLGGGGHAGAGAARVYLQLHKAYEKLEEAINSNVQPHLRVRDIMSTPVRTVEPDKSIAEVEELMKKYGHNGLVVSSDRRIKGIFSRSDLSKVKGHGLMHAPVEAYMSREVITISADSTIHNAQDIMVKNGIGRIPVVDQGKLEGIVTRSDLLAAYYGEETPYQHKNRYGSSLVKIKNRIRDISNLLDKLNPEVQEILKQAGKITSINNAEAYLVGGMVRDLFLERENRDIDIVVDGDTEQVISLLSEKLNGKWSFNSKFGTGSIKTGKYQIDVATARRERYLEPGALPEVESSDILEDLFRRDYTINALAVSLLPDNRGELTDYFLGCEDISSKLLRALHRFSFLDDPTRIIRGIRLVASLDFQFEDETYQLIKEALNLGDFSGLSPARVVKEFKILFTDKINKRLINILKKLPVYRLLGFRINITAKIKEKVCELEGILEYLREKNYNIEEWILRMAVFLEDIPGDVLDWGIKESELLLIKSQQKTSKKLLPVLNQQLGNEELYQNLQELNLEELTLLYINMNSVRARENIKYYFEELMDISLQINGYDLQELGIEPGPVYKDIMQDLFRARLNGRISSREEELNLARELINELE